MQRWDPWVNVQSGLTKVSTMPLSGPALLKVTPVAADSPSGDRGGVRSLLVGLAFAALAGYHGYRRNASAFWALAWAAGGFVCPVVTLPFAVSQGYAKRKD